MTEEDPGKFGEPWTDEEGSGYIRSLSYPISGSRIGQMTRLGGEEVYAARAVACVNGCAGIAQPEAVAGVVAALRDVKAACDMAEMLDWTDADSLANVVSQCQQRAGRALAALDAREAEAVRPHEVAEEATK